MHKVVLVLFSALIPLFGMSQTDLSAYKKDIFIGQSGYTLPYRILYPENYNPKKAYPLVLFMHGAGERGVDNEIQLKHGADLFLKDEFRKKNPAIVVFPQCAEQDYWVDVSRRILADGTRIREFPFGEKARPSTQMVIELVQQLIDEKKVDEQQLYIMGLSMGGMATFELLARFPDRWAAAIPICGGGNPILTRSYAKQTPIWLFHGEADEVVHVRNSRRLYKKLIEAGGKAKYTEYPGVNHDSWNNAFAEPGLLDWLFSHKKKKVAKERYTNPVFSKVEKKTFTYANKDGSDLGLDVYLPKGDEVKKRPAVLYLHGGGFAGGVRDDEGSVWFAERLAKMGYVAISMSYRLTLKGKSFSCDQDVRTKINTFQYAVEDIYSATNFLLEKKEELGIDDTKIVLAGSSAGAEAVLHAAYWEKVHLLPSCPGLPAAFRYAGVMSFAGAILNDQLISAKNAVPMALFHGTCDPLVPYATAPHHYCEENEPGYMLLHGGYAIAERLKELGKPYYLMTHCGGGHEWSYMPMNAHLPAIAKFMKDQVLDGAFQQLHFKISESGDCDRVEGLPFCK